MFKDFMILLCPTLSFVCICLGISFSINGLLLGLGFGSLLGGVILLAKYGPKSG